MPASPQRSAPGAHGGVAAVETHGDAMVLKARGDLGGHVAHEIADLVVTMLERHPRVVVVDLAKVNFIASAGLEAVLNAPAAAGKDTTIRIAASEHLSACQPSALESLTHVPAVFPTLADALATEL